MNNWVNISAAFNQETVAPISCFQQSKLSAVWVWRHAPCFANFNRRSLDEAILCNLWDEEEIASLSENKHAIRFWGKRILKWQNAEYWVIIWLANKRWLIHIRTWSTRFWRSHLSMIPRIFPNCTKKNSLHSLNNEDSTYFLNNWLK